MASEIKVTSEGYQRLVEELTYLKEVERPEAVKAIGIARSFGDLSENSEYDEAKDRQAKVESRIAELEELLKNVVIISDDAIRTDVVNIGLTVTVFNETRNEEKVYDIVGATEADPMNGKISDTSPIGKALIGHRANDRISIETPGGTIEKVILGITR
ncbi:MAG: transcription elongation factor GreA [Clostridia bacterium]|nr:transcription elongation factor GreA [Clostridia bacterium]